MYVTKTYQWILKNTNTHFLLLATRNTDSMGPPGIDFRPSFIYSAVPSWVRQESLSGDQCFHLLKSFTLLFAPLKRFLSDQIGQWCKDVRPMRPHISVVSDETKEGTNFAQVSRFTHINDRFYLLIPWFDALRRQPMSYGICCRENTAVVQLPRVVLVAVAVLLKSIM